MRFGKKIFPLYENSPDRDVEDLFYTEVIDLRVMLQIIALLDADKYDIVVRPHPRENRLGWMRLAKRLNLNISVSQWDQPFSHWLENVDILITPPSTSLYDAFFKCKKVVVIDNIIKARAHHLLTESDDNNQILKAACRPKSISEVIDIINSGDIPVNQEIVQTCLRDQACAELASNSIKNIVTCLVDLQPTMFGHRRPYRYLRVQTLSFLIIFVSFCQWLISLLSGQSELGSSFFLTPKRILWINNLTRQ